MKPALLPTEQFAPLPAAVAEVGQMRFEGNIIPHLWYQHITLESGKPDLPAITILAEIIYWYRPYQTRDKRGKPILHKRFEGDMFQCTAAYFEAKFGLTKNQVRKALKRLEDVGYIRREYRSIVQQGILRNNIMFIEPLPLAITYPKGVAKIVPMRTDTLSPTGDTLSPTGDTLSPTGDIFKGVKTTTGISTETTTTTPNPSSPNRQPTKPEPAHSGRGDRDIQNPNPEGQEPASHHGTVTQKPDEKKTVFQSEEGDGQLPELTYPAKLTTTEQQDIEAQLQSLPPDIAQQMLDVIQSRMQSGQIRTNPAALLRGVIRKYRGDPDAFDPSSGFQIAENRRHQAETAARLEAAHQASLQRYQESLQRYQESLQPHHPTPNRRLSEAGRAALASMRHLLRGT